VPPAFEVPWPCARLFGGHGLQPVPLVGIVLARVRLMRRPARLSDSSYSSTLACFVTFCSWQRRPLLADPFEADAVVAAAFRQSDRLAIDAAAYCVMPDHVHVLLIGDKSPGNVRVWVERVKQKTAFEFTQRTGQRLWQRSFFDYTLRPHEAVEPVVAYIVNNPVRAGFVVEPTPWPFWGSSRWSRGDLLETIAAFGSGRRPGRGVPVVPG